MLQQDGRWEIKTYHWLHQERQRCGTRPYRLIPDGFLVPIGRIEDDNASTSFYEQNIRSPWTGQFGRRSRTNLWVDYWQSRTLTSRWINYLCWWHCRRRCRHGWCRIVWKLHLRRIWQQRKFRSILVSWRLPKSKQARYVLWVPNNWKWQEE